MNSEEYFPTSSGNLKIGMILNFNIYIQTHDCFVLFHKKTLPFTKDVIGKLLEHEIDIVYISEDDAEEFGKHNDFI